MKLELFIIDFFVLIFFQYVSNVFVLSRDLRIPGFFKFFKAKIIYDLNGDLVKFVSFIFYELNQVADNSCIIIMAYI